jgi:hypothetical protein
MFEVERDLVLVLRQRVISSGKPEILDPQSVEWRTFRHGAVFFSQIPVPFGVVGVVHRAVLLAPGRMLKFNSELWFQNWYGRRSGMKKAASVGGLIVSEGSGLFARWERGLLVKARSTTWRGTGRLCAALRNERWPEQKDHQPQGRNCHRLGEKLPISQVSGAGSRQFAIVFSGIREMLERHEGRNWGDICAPTSRRRRFCRAFQMPLGSNPRRLFLEKETDCGGDGRIPMMAQFMNGITGTVPSRNTTVAESIRASFVQMALR